MTSPACKQICEACVTRQAPCKRRANQSAVAMLCVLPSARIVSWQRRDIMRDRCGWGGPPLGAFGCKTAAATDFERRFGAGGGPYATRRPGRARAGTLGEANLCPTSPWRVRARAARPRGKLESPGRVAATAYTQPSSAKPNRPDEAAKRAVGKQPDILPCIEIYKYDCTYTYVNL